MSPLPVGIFVVLGDSIVSFSIWHNWVTKTGHYPGCYAWVTSVNDCNYKSGSMPFEIHLKSLSCSAHIIHGVLWLKIHSTWAWYILNVKTKRWSEFAIHAKQRNVIIHCMKINTANATCKLRYLLLLLCIF